jgi:hypothetical protein
MNKNLFSIICICVIIMLLYVNFNNTERFYSTDDYQSIESYGKYINIKVLDSDETLTVFGTVDNNPQTSGSGRGSIDKINIEIPVDSDNNNEVLGINPDGVLGILNSGDPGAKWQVLKINNDNFITWINNMDLTQNNGVEWTIDSWKTDWLKYEKGDWPEIDEGHVISEPSTVWETRNRKDETPTRHALSYNSRLGSIEIRVGGGPEWRLSKHTTKSIKINPNKMTDLGPLQYLESDPNSIAIKLNIDDDKLNQIFNNGKCNQSGTSTENKCETWLPKDVVSSLCPGCIPP